MRWRRSGSCSAQDRVQQDRRAQPQLLCRLDQLTVLGRPLLGPPQGLRRILAAAVGSPEPVDVPAGAAPWPLRAGRAWGADLPRARRRPARPRGDSCYVGRRMAPEQPDGQPAADRQSRPRARRWGPQRRPRLGGIDPGVSDTTSPERGEEVTTRNKGTTRTTGDDRREEGPSGHDRDLPLPTAPGQRAERESRPATDPRPASGGGEVDATVTDRIQDTIVCGGRGSSPRRPASAPIGLWSACAARSPAPRRL
jgi:hypothetical protein